MKETSKSWLYELEKELHPDTLMSDDWNNNKIKRFINNLSTNTKRFRLYFISQLGDSLKQAKGSITQLIMVSDIVHNYLIKDLRAWKNSPQSSNIRYTFHQTLMLLESLIDDCSKYDNNLIADLPLTSFSVPDIRMVLKKRLDKLHGQVTVAGIDQELRELTLLGLQMLITRNRMKRSDVQYATQILDMFDNLHPVSNLEIENSLYQHDFNTPAFFHYCIKCCNGQLMDTTSLHEQLEILIGLEDRINALPALSLSRWMEKDESIREQLRVFYKEKKLYIRQRIKIRREEIHDRKLAEDTDRMQINLPVAQLGLFIRLFMEKGILQKNDVGKTFAFYARNFSTPKTSFISAESLQKKSTDVEFSTAKKMKGHLIGMINWLNEHYNTTNHSDS